MYFIERSPAVPSVCSKRNALFPRTLSDDVRHYSGSHRRSQRKARPLSTNYYYSLDASNRRIVVTGISSWQFSCKYPSTPDGRAKARKGRPHCSTTNGESSWCFDPQLLAWKRPRGLLQSQRRRVWRRRQGRGPPRARGRSAFVPW